LFGAEFFQFFAAHLADALPHRIPPLHVALAEWLSASDAVRSGNMAALAHARLVGNGDVLGNRSVRRIDPMKSCVAVFARIRVGGELANIA
jgi:hypothetical protein